MLESSQPAIWSSTRVPDQASRRCGSETIAAAGELKIPFTSGILVGIGETEDERIASLRGARRAARALRAHPGGDPPELRSAPEATTAASRPRSRTRPRASTGGPGCGTGRTLDAPAWACEVTVEDMKRLIGETRRLMPGVGIQVPPNLSDWWIELVRAGATDLGGLSANGDHISPEHPFPSPTEVRKRLRADGLALSERLCVYPEYIDPEWISRPVMDVIKAAYWSFIPRRGSGRTRRVDARRRRRAAGGGARARRACAERRGADRAVRRDAAGGDRGHALRGGRAARPSWPARP